MRFPATEELLVFVVTTGLAIAGVSYLRLLDFPRLNLLKRYLTDPKEGPAFPRRWVSEDLKFLSPMRKMTARHLMLRFKFTFAMLFLNIYTYVFTSDLDGVISPAVLQRLGFSYENFMQHRWFVLITSDFIHFHALHLTVNMVMLILFSGSLELLAGAKFAAAVYVLGMNSNVPNGLVILPALRMFFPTLWTETVQFVDVGASLGIIGSLGGLCRFLRPKARWLVLSVTILISVGAALIRHELIGIDHAFSALLGYLAAEFLVRRLRLLRSREDLESHPTTEADCHDTHSSIAS